MDYRIRKGDPGWVTEKRGKPMGADSKTPGAETWTDQKYHANLEQASLSLLDRLMRDSVVETVDVQTIVQVVRSAVTEVRAAVAEAVAAAKF